MPTVPCATCGNPFSVGPSRTRFCDRACYVRSLREHSAQTLIARFWAKVKRGDATACWLWTGGTIKGYGQFHPRRDAGKNVTVYAHRFAWTITFGPIPDNQCVCHRCDIPLCVNPNHLFLGTQAVNLEDARRKGRLVDGQHLIKVSDGAMQDIRRRYQPRVNGRRLAEEHGVSLSTILRIAAGTQRVVHTVSQPDRRYA